MTEEIEINSIERSSKERELSKVSIFLEVSIGTEGFPLGTGF